jgi:hypothetical protein
LLASAAAGYPSGVKAPVPRFPAVVAVLLAAACAPTTAPSPPPRETLLVVNGGDHTLSLVPVDSLRPTRRVPLGAPGLGPALDVAARGSIALVAGGAGDALHVVNLATERLQRTIPLEPGSRPSAAVLVSETVAHAALPGRHALVRVDLVTGDTASVAAGRYPVDVVLTRGRLFVVNANLGPCATGPLCPLGPGWITVVDPVANARAGGRDSIPLPGPGQPRAAEVGGDGMIYVINTGDPTADQLGRLTIVDPLRREEVGSFGGFGFLPTGAASDGRERLFVISPRDGLMEFNTRTRRLVRGAGSGVLVGDNVAAAVDSDGRVHAIESGGCAPGSVGRLRLLRADLTEAQSLLLGECPTAAVIVLLPAITQP